jgi:hypothetical protein
MGDQKTTKMVLRKRKRRSVPQPKLLNNIDDITWMYLPYFDIADLQAFVGTNKETYKMLREILQSVAAAMLPQYKSTRAVFPRLTYWMTGNVFITPKVHPFLNGFLTDDACNPQFINVLGPDEIKSEFFPTVTTPEVAPLTTFTELFSAWFATRCVICGHCVPSNHPARSNLSTPNGTVCMKCVPSITHFIPGIQVRYSGNITACFMQCQMVLVMTWLKGVLHSGQNATKLLKWATPRARSNMIRPVPISLHDTQEVEDRLNDKLRKLLDSIFTIKPSFYQYTEILPSFLSLKLPLLNTKEEFLTEFKRISDRQEEALIYNLPPQLVEVFSFHPSATTEQMLQVWNIASAWNCPLDDLPWLWRYCLRSSSPSRQSFVAFCVSLIPPQDLICSHFGCMLRIDFHPGTNLVFTAWKQKLHAELETLQEMAPYLCLVCRKTTATHKDERFSTQQADPFNMCASCYHIPVPIWNSETNDVDLVVSPH